MISRFAAGPVVGCGHGKSSTDLRHVTNLPPANKGRFRPGQSGNPNGRPKIPDELRKLGPLAIAKLSQAVTEPGLAPQQIQAARDVIDRLYGKAPQALEVAGVAGRPVETKIIVEYVGHDN